VSSDLSAWRRRLEPLTDPVIAALVLLLSVLPLIQSERCGCGEGVPGWAYLFVVAQSLPLALRRRFPFGAPLLTGLLTMAYGLTSLPDPPVEYAGLVALYTVAAYAERRLAHVAGAVAVVGIAGVYAWELPVLDVEDITVTSLICLTAWLLGENARSRRERVIQAEARAEQLERARAAESEAAVVAERNRIARELHDVVAHHVSMMVVQAEAGPVVVEHDPARAAASFDAISAAGKQALSEMRRLLGVLKENPSAPLAPQPGLSSIPELVAGVRAAGLDVTLGLDRLDVEPEPAVALSAYRLVQEALTNCLRHAGPASVLVHVAREENHLVVRVLDDGVGGPCGEGGHGLVAMRERVALLGGRLQVGPRDGGGWGVEAELPLAPVAVR
jgi:signal transduction histidine kinase